MRQNDDRLKRITHTIILGPGRTLRLPVSGLPRRGQARPAHPRRPNIGTDGSQVRALGIPI